MNSLFRKILEQARFDGDFFVSFPDGSSYQRGSRPLFRLSIRSKNALNHILRNPSVGFGEGYMSGEIDLEGDMQQLCRLGFQIKTLSIRPGLLEGLRFTIGYFMRRNTLSGSRRNIAAHYDLGNDFYSLWLDPQYLQYTCAYFNSPTDSLSRAQEQKLHLICRKLRLAPGESVVEAGCGWGGFARFAARHYGVKVRSYNISKEQISYAQARAKKEGFSNKQVEYILDDYRSIPNDGRLYDKFVSIGMLEHVGPANYSKLYDIISKSTKPEGLAMVHTISRSAPAKMDAWLERYIFPGSYIPSLSEIVTPLENLRRDLFVADVENLRYHYALTLDHWSKELMRHADQIERRYGKSFLRMFYLYLQSSAAGFRWGGIQLFQLLLHNGYLNHPPFTRHHFLDLKSKAEAAGKRGRKASSQSGRSGRSQNKRSANGRPGARSGGRSGLTSRRSVRSRADLADLGAPL